jgi:hypothetical protein
MKKTANLTLPSIDRLSAQTGRIHCFENFYASKTCSLL